MLKVSEDKFFCVEYRDLEQFILEETGYEYEIVANEECRNDSVHRFRVRAPESEYANHYWDHFKATGEQKPCYLGEILQGLCADGKIQPGNYLVCVCW
jgi:hypothetical protein